MAAGSFTFLLREQRFQLPTPVVGPMKADLRKVPPTLEGIKFGDRWGVIFSPYDLSCALEKHNSLECQGYIREDAARIGLNVLSLFLLKFQSKCLLHNGLIDRAIHVVGAPMTDAHDPAVGQLNGFGIVVRAERFVAHQQLVPRLAFVGRPVRFAGGHVEDHPFAGQ